MKIPEKIKIGGKVYTVEITNKMDLGINNVSAEIIYSDLVIRVSPQAQGKMEADFLHEVTHGILEHLGFGKKRLHRFYDAFSAEHDKLIEHYEMPDGGAWLADMKLKEIGVDVAAWNKESK